MTNGRVLLPDHMKTVQYKERLKEEKKRLESEMGAVGRRNPVVPNDWEPVPPKTGSESDLIDHADAAINRETNAAIFNDLEARYDSVLAALSRIEKNTYGTCGVCGNKIEEARLLADPAATTCTSHL